MKITQTKTKEPMRAIVEIVRYFSLYLSKILWRIEFVNTENIPNEGEKGFVIMPNHQTYLDPFWLCIPVKKDMRFMAWDKAFEILILGSLLRLVGAFPISLERGGTIKTLKDSLKFLREGKALLVFPEGEREFADGRLLPFKTGAVRLASEANVPILPVTVCGGNRIWSRDHWFPRPFKVKIIYHPIVKIADFKNNKNLEKITDEIKKTISSALDI